MFEVSRVKILKVRWGQGLCVRYRLSRCRCSDVSSLLVRLHQGCRVLFRLISRRFHPFQGLLLPLDGFVKVAGPRIGCCKGVEVPGVFPIRQFTRLQCKSHRLLSIAKTGFVSRCKDPCKVVVGSGRTSDPSQATGSAKDRPGWIPFFAGRAIQGRSKICLLSISVPSIFPVTGMALKSLHLLRRITFLCSGVSQYHSLP